MPQRLCLICRIEGRLLENTSQNVFVLYYRCDRCGHIWTHEKANPDAPPKDITIKPATRDEQSRPSS